MNMALSARPEPVEGRAAQRLAVRQAPHERSGSNRRFAGYAALFGTRDAGGDTIMPGAFTSSLGQQNEPLPLLWRHRPDRRIGTVERAGEDGRGLKVIARIDRHDSRAAALLRSGALTGLSFGYRVRDARIVPGGRVLHRIDLFEISLVPDPLQHRARVHLVI